MISEILKYLRKSKGFKQIDIAKKINSSISTISGYETNYSQPTFDTILKIADICGYDVIFKDRVTKKEITSKNIKRMEI